MIKTGKLNSIDFFTLLLILTYYFLFFVTIPIARDDKMGIATGGAYITNIFLATLALFGTIYCLTELLNKNKRKMSRILILIATLIIGLISIFSDFEFEIAIVILVIAFIILIFSQTFILWKLKKDKILFFIFSIIIAVSTYIISLTDLKYEGKYEIENWEYSKIFEIMAILNIIGFIYIIIENRFKQRRQRQNE
uniref:hypothetical protein n=1 Tax=uncultured Polaribacter sp. TaxID=174711 RepID=UPI0026103B47|nr:hypothetical protein [uncultured Polaribacter sp.]